MFFILLIQSMLFLNVARSESIDVSIDKESSTNITTKVLITTGTHNLPTPDKFKPVQNDEIKISYTNNYIWLKLKLENSSSISIKRVLKIQHTMAGEVVFYNSRGETLARTGSAVNWKERNIKSHYPALEIQLPPNSTEEILIRRHSHHRFDARVILTTMSNLKDIDNRIEQIVLLYMGAVFSLLIYNLFLGLYTKKRVYLYYSAFMASMATLSMNMQGELDEIFHFLPFNPSDYLMMASSGTGFLALVFTNRFLRWNVRHPRFKKFYYFVLGGMLLHFFGFPLLKPIVGAGMGNTVDIFIGLTLLSMMVMGIKSVMEKNPLAYFYMLSWAGIFIGAFVWFGMYYKLFPHNIITQTSLLWGNIIEMLVISLGLGYQITILDKEKERARIDAIGKEKYQTLARVLLHDIVTPLSLVTNYTKKLQKSEISTEQTNNFAQKIHRAVDIILNIIESVKNQESETIDDISGKISAFNLKEAVDDSLFVYQQRLNEKNIAVECPDKMPKVRAEKILLTNQVLSNILSNAIKYSEPNSKIKIEIHNGGEKTSLSIRDYGHGIHSSDLELLERNGSLKSKDGTLGEKGNGYGLLLIKTFVKAMNGEVKIESKVQNGESTDQGTTVTVILPSA